uniref:C2H2-type domain-containing protein n=1 Tax=Strigamia maritima TaxID=126957 RepID=T1J536_STRMM
MSEEPRISPLLNAGVSYASPAPSRTSPMSPRASPMLSSRGSPLMHVLPSSELLLKTSVIVNHIQDGTHRMQLNDQDCPLDFSVKKGCDERNLARSVGVLNLSKATDGLMPILSGNDDRPLDLSVPRKRNSDAITPDGRKTPKMDGTAPLSPWGAHFPFRFTPSSSPTSSVEIPLWNGKVKSERIQSSTNNSSMSHHHQHHHHHHQSANKAPVSPEPTATKALEKMTELMRMGGQESEVYHRMLGGGGRQSAWQSHWLSKGAEQARDVLKCVWCKQSFKSLAEMTAHMKEARHCGVNVTGTNASTVSGSKGGGGNASGSTPIAVSAVPVGSSASSGTSSTSEELNMLIKETMPLPRKLVRGQDVWLGKGAEQTKQILKCMWCGQSFKSLADMTTHMQQTQHYTNIISQEQIISWKSPEDKTSAQSHVNAVLTCKVCDQAFSSLKELSNHMVKNSHYKEHILRSITESGGRRRQTREKRKKSLPVRKLLELERAQHDLHKGGSNHESGHHRKAHKDGATVTCEKCNEKIETGVFVEHVRQCVGNGKSSKNLLKSALTSSEKEAKEEIGARSQDEQSDGGGVGGGSRANSVDSNQPRASAMSSSGSGKSGRRSRASPDVESEAPSVLNAIERLIEKSFDTRTRKSVVTTLGGSSTNILKRLGVEDSSHYTKPLIDNSSPLPHTGTRDMLSPVRPSSKDTVTSVDGSISRNSPNQERPAGAQSTSPAPLNSPDIRDSSCIGGNCCSPAQSRKERDSPAVSSPRVQDHSPAQNSKNNTRATPSPMVTDLNEDAAESCKPKNSSPLIEARDAGRKSPASSISGSSVSEEHLPTGDEKGEGKSPKRIGSLCSPRDSPDSLVSRSPCTSECSFSHTNKERVYPCPEDLSVKSRDSDKASTPSPASPGAASSGGGARFFSGGLMSSTTSGDHPLKELQKLLDKTDAHMTKASTSTGSSASGSTVVTSAGSHHQVSPGAILAFSWACNDAVMTDSIMKCAYCDTPFISKGAYRHHLSKMHFVKDGAVPEGSSTKVSSHSKNSANSSNGNNNNNSNSNNPATNYNKSTSGSLKANNNNNFDESPTSKFLKYTELAKQLSSKYV